MAEIMGAGLLGLPYAMSKLGWIVGLTTSVHTQYGWRSYAKVARQGFKRGMHRLLFAVHSLVIWSGVALLLQVPTVTYRHLPSPTVARPLVGRRAAAPVIHWLSPLSNATAPSRLLADFSTTRGRLRVILDTKPAIIRRAAGRSNSVTSIPA